MYNIKKNYQYPQILFKTKNLIKINKNEMNDFKYKVLNNKITPINFKLEDIVRIENLYYKLNKMKIKDIKNKVNEFNNRIVGSKEHYYQKTNEFLCLEDFMEFYIKFYKKRKEEMEKDYYKQKFENEVEKIKLIKVKNYWEIVENKKKLGQKITITEKGIENFKNSLEYAIKKLNYRQAQKMLRKLTVIPQPPNKKIAYPSLNLSKFKTSNNFYRAFTKELEKREKNNEIAFIHKFDSEKFKKNNNIDVKKLKNNIQYNIDKSYNIIDSLLYNRKSKILKKK